MALCGTAALAGVGAGAGAWAVRAPAGPLQPGTEVLLLGVPLVPLAEHLVPVG